ncbi:MAG: hypothetical protein P4L28_11910 [Paludibacteraceae bacterium]|nr:hypothetical protein [Paludibacteraceae bacterium]
MRLAKTTPVVRNSIKLSIKINAVNKFTDSSTLIIMAEVSNGSACLILRL